MGKYNQKKPVLPKLPNMKPLIQAGIDPKTGLPIKYSKNMGKLKGDIKKQLRIIDEQDAINVGIWYNINRVLNMTSQKVERMLYYKYQLCFFYNKELDSFFLLPFALSSKDGNGLDVYGRYKYITPIAFNSGDEEHKKTPIEEYLSNLHLRVIYSPIDLNYIDIDTLKELQNDNVAVIIQDYSPQYDQTNGIPRYLLQDSLLDVMSDCIPFMRTNLLLNSGVTGMRVNDADQKDAVIDASISMETNALNGLPWIPIEGQIELQELTGKNASRVQDYMLAMQSLENYRLSTHGIDSGGLFEKKAHTLQSEQEMNGSTVGLVLQDKVSLRQDACNIINSIWALGIWYEPSETITKSDINGDGLLYDRQTVINKGGNSNNDNDGQL